MLSECPWAALWRSELVASGPTPWVDRSRLTKHSVAALTASRFASVGTSPVPWQGPASEEGVVTPLGPPPSATWETAGCECAGATLWWRLWWRLVWWPLPGARRVGHVSATRMALGRVAGPAGMATAGLAGAAGLVANAAVCAMGCRMTPAGPVDGRESPRGRDQRQSRHQREPQDRPAPPRGPDRRPPATAHARSAQRRRLRPYRVRERAGRGGCGRTDLSHKADRSGPEQGDTLTGNARWRASLGKASSLATSTVGKQDRSGAPAAPARSEQGLRIKRSGPERPLARGPPQGGSGASQGISLQRVLISPAYR